MPELNEWVSDERLAEMLRVDQRERARFAAGTFSFDRHSERISILTELQQRRASVVTLEMVEAAARAMAGAAYDDLVFSSWTRERHVEAGWPKHAAAAKRSLTAALSVSHETGDDDAIPFTFSSKILSVQSMRSCVDHSENEVCSNCPKPAPKAHLLPRGGGKMDMPDPRMTILTVNCTVNGMTSAQSFSIDNPHLVEFLSSRGVVTATSRVSLTLLDTDETKGVKRERGAYAQTCKDLGGIVRHNITRAETAEASLAAMTAERDHWKSNHDQMVQRNSVLRERPDLPADRLPDIARYKAEIGALRKIVSECAAALPNGAFILPDASLEFMAKLPAEIASVCARAGDPS